MNLTSKPLLAAGGGLIVGALIGMGIGSSGGKTDHAQVEAQRELATGMGALQTSLRGVDARIAELEGRIDTVEASVNALGEAQTGRLEALSTKLEGLGGEIGGQVSSLGGAVAASLGQGLDTLKSELAGVADKLKAVGSEAPADASAEAPAETAAAAPAARPAAPAAAAPATGEAPKGELILIGSAASFGDALSVFLSTVNPETGTARVAVNGPSTIALALNEPASAGGCEVTLTGFGDGGAYIDGVCAAPEEGAAAPAAEEGASDEGGSDQGASDQAGSDQAGSDQAGSDQAASDQAAAPAEGEAIQIGAAGSFGEGKVRIFVSGVDNEAKTARVALNSLRTAEMKLQDKVDAEGCKVELTGITPEGATFKVDC